MPCFLFAAVLLPLAGSLTDRQRRHLAERAGSRAGEFERLAYGPVEPLPQARAPAMGSGQDRFPSS
ncbi:MAG: hypothetical protein ACUVT2_08540 [Thiobacillaceae bacterium]